MLISFEDSESSDIINTRRECLGGSHVGTKFESTENANGTVADPAEPGNHTVNSK